MTEYKIIASDLDGTLLNSRSEISAENLDAIHQIINKGIVFVPCTGRTYSEIPAEIKNLSDIRYVIHSNGAVVYDRITGDRILNGLSNEVVNKLMDIYRDFDVHVTFRKDGECFVDSRYQDDSSFEYYNVCREHQVVVRNFSVFLDDFEKAARESHTTEVFALFFHTLEEKFACKKVLQQLGGLRLVEISEYNLEIMNESAGKGNALYSLADKLGVAYADTMSLGDSDNDASITQAAGIGIAVSNACDSLKQVADEIICSNDEHAIAYVLEHYFS